MAFKLRIARATNDLEKIANMYKSGLDLEVIGSFREHDGFDGVMLGSQNSGYHFEFTKQKGHAAPHSPSAETLLVFYVEEPNEVARMCEKMTAAGFKKVSAHNPYWDKCGTTFEDPEEYRVVICHRPWTAN